MNATGSPSRAGEPPSSRQRQDKRPLFPAWAWAAAVVLALITGYAVRQMQIDTSRLRGLREQVNAAELRNHELQQRLELGQVITSVMMSPDSLPLTLVPRNKARPAVHAYLHPRLGIALTAGKMPQVPPARTLELWCVPKKGEPVSLGTFKPDAEGGVQMVAPMRIPIEQIAGLEISEEAAGGSARPTGSPAWAGHLK